MKKLLCLLLSVLLLLSFTACDKKKEPKEKSEEEQIEELLVGYFKSKVALATKEELKSIYTEAYWESREGTLQDFDRVAENGGVSEIVIDGETKTKEDVQRSREEIYGENYVITAEIKGMETVDYKEILDDGFKYFFPYIEELDIEEARSATFVICIEGDKKVTEEEEKTITIFKIDGKWYLQ